MSSRIVRTSVVIALVMCCAGPAVADEPLAPQSVDGSRMEMQAVPAYDVDWGATDARAVRLAEESREMPVWTLALLGPAAMIIILAALGLTITLRSLRKDVREQRDPYQEWRDGSFAHARRTGER